MSDRDDSETKADDSASDSPEEAEEITREAAAESSPDQPKRSRSSKTDPSARSRSKSRNREVAAAAASSSSVPAARVGIFVVLALAVGGAAGWFGHIQQAKAQQLRADSAPAPSGSGAAAGPCGAWKEKICASGGEKSAACQEATGATELLTPSTCEVALASLPATLAKLKAARASCDTLVGKLCTDLPPGSPTCSMVKERTPSFPSKRCDEMLLKYDDVLTELRSIDQQGGPQMGQAPH